MRTLPGDRSSWMRTVLVLGGSLAAYVASALLTGLVTGSPIIGAAVSNCVALAVALSYRLTSTATLRPAPLPDVARTWLFWCTVVIAASACWLSGQSAAVLVYQSWGSAGFDAAASARAAGPAWLVLATMVLLAPIGEEALLRGVAYPALRRHWPPLAAAFVTAAVFALLHGNLVQIVLTVPLGILLAYVYEACQRLWPVIAIHALFNALALVIPTDIAASLATAGGVTGLTIALGLTLVVMHLIVTTRAVPTGAAAAR